MKCPSACATTMVRVRAWALAALTSWAQPSTLIRPIKGTINSEKQIYSMWPHLGENREVQ